MNKENPLLKRSGFLFIFIKSIDTCCNTCYNIYSERGIILKSYSSRDVIKILKSDGWFEISCVGDHHQFKHPTKKGKVTITHPVKDIPIKTLKSISKQSGVTFP